MYELVVLFSCLAVAVSDPGQGAGASWPWVNRPGQTATPAPNWQGNYAWPTGGGGQDHRGWGPSTSSGSGNSGWGLTRCSGTYRRSSCAPSIFEIEQQLIGAAQKMMGFCNVYSNRPLREIYGIEHFKLRVQLSEFSEDDIQVRVRQRLVTILASSCSAEYAAVRVLPDVVDARRAVWKMDAHTLTVLFPYNITPDTEVQSRCGREFHGDPIIVPKCAAGTQFARDYDMSFTDATLMNAIRRALQELARDGSNQYTGSTG